MVDLHLTNTKDYIKGVSTTVSAIEGQQGMLVMLVGARWSR